MDLSEVAKPKRRERVKNNERLRRDFFKNRTKQNEKPKKARNQKIVGEPKKCLMVERCRATKCDDVTT